MVNNKLTALAAWRPNGPDQQNGHGAEVRK